MPHCVGPLDGRCSRWAGNTCGQSEWTKPAKPSGDEWWTSPVQWLVAPCQSGPTVLEAEPRLLSGSAFWVRLLGLVGGEEPHPRCDCPCKSCDMAPALISRGSLVPVPGLRAFPFGSPLPWAWRPPLASSPPPCPVSGVQCTGAPLPWCREGRVAGSSRARPPVSCALVLFAVRGLLCPLCVQSALLQLAGAGLLRCPFLSLFHPVSTLPLSLSATRERRDREETRTLESTTHPAIAWKENGKRKQKERKKTKKKKKGKRDGTDHRRRR